MTVVAYRLPANQVYLTSPGGHGPACYYALIEGRSLEGLDLDALFTNCNQLRPGDLVNVTAFTDKTWNDPREIAVAVVNFVGRDQGGVSRVSAVWWQKPVEIPRSQYATSKPKVDVTKLEIVKEFGAGWNVRDEKGNVIEKFKTKVEAEQYVDNLAPKPKPEAKKAAA